MKLLLAIAFLSLLPQEKPPALLIVTTDSQLIKGVRKEPSLLSSAKWLRDHSLLTVDVPIPFVCDASLVTYPKISSFSVFAEPAKRGAALQTNLNSLSASERAQVRSLIQKSPFAAKYRRFSENANLVVEIYPNLSAKIDGPNSKLTVPGRLEIPDISKQKAISFVPPNEMVAKEDEPTMVEPVQPLQMFSVFNASANSLPVFKQTLDVIIEAREKSRKQLAADSQALALNWFKTAVGSEDDLSRPQKFSDLSPQLQTALERPFLDRAKENGFSSRESAQRFLRNQTLKDFAGSLMIWVYSPDGTGWSISVLR